MTALATILIGMIGSQIHMDQNWLARQGPGPYCLNQAGTTYVLQADVTTRGTTFIVMAPNITLNLNGHTATYDNTPPIRVPNGGFEEGTGPTDVPGWDVSRAPGAIRAPARIGMWGDWMLRLPDLSSTATLVSSPTPIPEAGVEYAAIITPRANKEPTVTLSVVDDDTGVVLASAKSRDPGRGYAAVAKFTPMTTHPVRLQVEIAPPAGQTSLTADLDYVAVYRTGSYGVVATPSPWTLPSHLQTVIAAHGGIRNVANLTITNGSIVQGGRSFSASAVSAMSLNGITIDHVEATASGDDTDILNLTYAGNLVVTDSRLIGQLDRISDRMRLFAAIQLTSVRGPVRIQGNTITGTMHSGINFSRKGIDDAPVSITRNVIQHETLGTNGYGILVNQTRNFEIASNRIEPVNGRGLMLDTVSHSVTEDGRVHDNIVEGREHPNLEYPAGALEAIGMTIRVFPNGAVRNVTFTNNTFRARTGLGYDWAAAAVRVSIDNRNSQMTNSGLVFQGNTFQAVLDSIDPSMKSGYRGSSAWGLTIPQAPPGTGLRFIKNAIRSNHISLNIGDDSGYQCGVSDVLFEGNTISKLAQGTAMPYVGVAVGNWETAVSNVQLIGTTYADGATPDLTFMGGLRKEISLGRFLNLTVTNPDGSAAAGAAVSVLDRENRQVYNGATDARGASARITIVTTTYRQGGANSPAIETSDRGPFTVVVSAGPRKKTLTIDRLSGDLSLSARLP